MASEILIAFERAIVGRTCRVERDECTWSFIFGQDAVNGCAITATTWWRIVGPERIELTAQDDGQLFGLPAPVNALDRSRKLLASALTAGATISGVTSDLQIDFENRIRLEILNSSAGYESWEARFRHAGEDLTLVSCGGGLMQFVAVPAGARPPVVQGRLLPRN